MASEVDQIVIGCQQTFSFMCQNQNGIQPVTGLAERQQKLFKARESVTDAISQKNK